MKIKTSILIIVILICSCTNNSTNTDLAKNKTKQLRNIVMFKFKESSSEIDIKKIENAFIALPNKIKEIDSFEWSINNSPEELNKGFTHSFLVTFANEKDREIYLPHPDHIAFVDILKPHLEDVLVLDYWTN